MKKIIIVCEGQTEETFVRRLLYYELWSIEVFVEPRLIPTSPSARGGALNRQRVLHFLRHVLQEQKNTYVTTFFDLHALPKDLHGLDDISSTTDPISRAEKIEIAFRESVIGEIGCRRERFFPYIQPYEFEALLFSDTTGFTNIEPKWKVFAGKLLTIRKGSKTPEFINDGAHTHPSAHLRDILCPPYNKVIHGPEISDEIGIVCMRSECQHFDSWLRHIENLPALN